MTGVFDAYAAYYDLLYRDKDYAAETRYVNRLLQRYAPGARQLLELGCGTGGHAAELATHGYDVTGVDLSPAMVRLARAKCSSLSDDNRPEFLVGDLKKIDLGRTFDAVVALFHVMSYQTSNEDLEAAFSSAARHLRPGGVLLFDFWHGPGVLNDPPVKRVRRMAGPGITVTREAQPVVYATEKIVDVKFNIKVAAPDGEHRFEEIHRMRYLFAPEIDRLLGPAGLQRESFLVWGSEEVPGTDAGYACVVARRFDVHA